jgi:hypothetical protein
MKPMIPIRPQADATSKLSRGAKAESTRIGVGNIGNKERPISIDRLDQIRTADAVPSASGVAYGNQASQVVKQPMCHQ